MTLQNRVPGVAEFGTPTAETDFGLTSGAGSKSSVARSDHTHGTPTAPTTTSIGAVPTTLVDAKGDLVVATAADTVGRLAVGSDGQILTADPSAATGLRWVSLFADLVTTGQETFPRGYFTNTAVAQTSGMVRLVYFTARKSETSTQVRVLTGGTAAAATPTLCKIGLWSIAANGDGTLVASTANDTTLFGSGVTAYTRSWSTPYNMVTDQVYALGILVVSGATMPTFGGAAAAVSSEWAVAPRRSGVLSGLADLDNFVAASVGTSGTCPYGVILP